MTNLEGRVLRRRRRRRRPRRRAQRPRRPRRDRRPAGPRRRSSTASPRAVFDELRRASAGGTADYAGISYERIDAERGVFWPCPAEDARPGTPRLFQDGFATPDGRARFHVVHHRDAAEQPDDEYPYRLTTGRTRAHYQSGTQTRRTKALLDAEPEPVVDIHPDLAARLGVTDGSDVSLRTRRGAARMRARLSPDDPPRHRLRPVPLGRARRRSTTSRTPPSTRRRGCPSSRPAPWPSRPRSPPTERTPTRDDHPAIPAGRVRVRGARAGQARAAGPEPELHRARGGHRPGALRPRRQLLRRARVRPARLRRHAVAVAPGRREGATCTSRCASSRTCSPAAPSRSTTRRPRAPPAPSSSTADWWRSEVTQTAERPEAEQESAAKSRLVVVGNGMSGARALEEILARGGGGHLRHRRSSATSPTATTTGSCCPRCSRTRRAGPWTTRTPTGRTSSTSTPWTGTTRTASRCTPACGSCASTGTPRSSTATTGR